MRVVVLAGGTGGAKLAAGLQEVLGDKLSVIVNTGDDVEALGVYVAPDPDLVTYWLCDEIDSERGWGIRDDTFTVFERLKRLGAPSWFGLSDRDLATCLQRSRRLAQGARPTEIQGEIAAALGARAAVLPMSDTPVRTQIRTDGGWLGFQEYLVRERAEPEIAEIAFEGAEFSKPTPEVLSALSDAEVVIVGPSNPVISIGPILAVRGMRDAIASSPGPVIAVSPFVAGEILKGPTVKFRALRRRYRRHADRCRGSRATRDTADARGPDPDARRREPRASGSRGARLRADAALAGRMLSPELD